jgi:actin-related protein
MSHGNELKSKGAQALRAAGFLPCPRFWLTGEQMELLVYMAHQNADEVNRIRAEASRPQRPDDQRKQQEIDAAWARMKEGRE